MLMILILHTTRLCHGKQIMAGGHKAHGPDSIGMGDRPARPRGAAKLLRTLTPSIVLVRRALSAFALTLGLWLCPKFLGIAPLYRLGIGNTKRNMFLYYITERFNLEHIWKVCLAALNCQTCIPGLTGYVSFQTCRQHVVDCTSLKHKLSFAYCDWFSNIYPMFGWVHSFSSPYAQFRYCDSLINTMQG